MRDDGVLDQRPSTNFGKPIALLVVGALLLLLHTLKSESATDWTNPASLALLMEKTSVGGSLGFVTLSTVLIAIGIPRLIFFALGGMLMGFGEGLLFALLSSVAGSYASFAFLRWSGRAWLMERSSHGVLLRITSSEPTVVSVFAVRQLPVSNLLINAGLAMGRVKSPVFIVGSILGFLPQGLIATLIGSGVSQDHLAHGAGHLGSAAAIIATVWCACTMRQRRKKHFSEQP